mmetsp:Transcript_103210/g.205110  ORF Transcript_103210/g.205110 Transcript_103210/m.205110 type:complete len:226 (+) Transcript_103210:59-736(+)
MPELPLGMRPLTMRVDMNSVDSQDMPGLGAAGESATVEIAPAHFARSRHLALQDPEYWRRNGPPKSKVPPYFPRFVGGRKMQPLTNNSEGARSLLHPDPWSTATLDTLRRRREEGTGHLFGTHTIKGHSAILVHPLHPSRAVEYDQEMAESDVSPDVSLTISPRFLTRQQINFEASRAVRESMPRRQAFSQSARARFGKGTMYSEAVVDADMVPKRADCRGKYTG